MTATWIRDLDLTTYRARTGDYELVVTRLGLDRWRPEVWEDGIVTAGPIAPDRPAAQGWCEQEASRIKRQSKGSAEANDVQH